MSDRIAVMLDGHIEQLADPDTIYDHPASAFVAGFIGQNNFLPGTATDDGTGLEGDGFAVRGRPARRPTSSPASRRWPPCGRRPSTLVAERPGHRRVNALAGYRGRRLPPRRRHPVRRARPTTASCIARQPRHRAPKLPPGQDVWCTWDPDRVHLFSAEQASLVLADPAAERPQPEARRPSRPGSRTFPKEDSRCMADDEVRILADPSSAAGSPQRLHAAGS